MTGNKIYLAKFGWEWSDILSFRGQCNYTKIRRRISRLANKANRNNGKKIIREAIARPTEYTKPR